MGKKGRVSALDVSKYILEQRGQMATFKLQKLVFYSQAWNLALDRGPLFPEKTTAWVNGPVVLELYKAHRGRYEIAANELPSADSKKLSDSDRILVDEVLAVYADLTPHELVERTHSEKPWLEARRGLDPRERGNRVISLEAMKDYYSSLLVPE